jgi:cytochrome c-type biogenesis protein
MINLIQNALNQGGALHLLFVIGLVYLGGILTSFTPCIFPMIPITFSILGKGNGTETTRSQLIKRVLIYGFGVTIAFVSVGVVAILTRSMFGALTQHILFKIVVANLFILLGLNTLGVVYIPQFNMGSKPTQSYVGLFSMGLAAGLSLSPCTLPILAIVLHFAAQTSLLIGSIMMWVYACGFMTIIILLSIFGSKAFSSLLKKRGFLPLMDKVLAILCFAVAEWMLLGAF